MWNPQLFVGMFLRVCSLWSVCGYISQGLRSLISLWMYFPGFWSVFPRICISDLFCCTSKGGQYLISLWVYIPWGVRWCFAGVPEDRSLCCNYGCCVLRPEFSYFVLGLCPRMRSLSSSSVCLSNLQALLSVGVCPKVWSLIHLRVRGPGCQTCLWVSIRMWDISYGCLSQVWQSVLVCLSTVCGLWSVYGCVSQVATYFPLI